MLHNIIKLCYTLEHALLLKVGSTEYHMGTSTPLIATIDQWITDLRAAHQSPNTVANHQYAMRIFLRWLDARADQIDLDQLTTLLLSAYITSLTERRPRLTQSTIFAYIGVLVRWLEFLINEGKLAGIRNHRGQSVTPDRVRTLLERMVGKRQPAVAPRIPDLRRLPAYYHDALATFVRSHGRQLPTHPPAVRRTYLNLLRNRALLATLFCTGGRINEVIGLDVADVWDGRAVQYAVTITGKGKRQRDLRLDDLARDWITAYLDARKRAGPMQDVPLFVSHGPTAKGARLSDVTAWRVVKEAATALADMWVREGRGHEETVALRAISPHSLRHFFAQAMLDEGANYDEIALVLGHSSTKVTQQVYARLAPERVREIADTYAPRAVLTLPSQEQDS